VKQEQGKRILVRSKGEIEIEEFSVRQPGPSEILIRAFSSLISADTELGAQEVDEQDYCSGYSNAGRIVAVGGKAKGFSIGDRVLSLGNYATHVTVSASPGLSHVLLKTLLSIMPPSES